MGGSYKQCDACGKRALSIAIRCPGCGHEFPANQVPQGAGGPDLGRFVTPKAVAAVLAFVAVLGSTVQPGKEKAAVESSMARTGPVDTVRAAALPAALPAESVSELLVARGWTHVRRSRSVRAPVEAVLTPGDTVLADSLEQGWYRVALEGEVLGYAHRSTLAVAGPGMKQSPSGRAE
jgi:hypothetical protein